MCDQPYTAAFSPFILMHCHLLPLSPPSCILPDSQRWNSGVLRGSAQVAGAASQTASGVLPLVPVLWASLVAQAVVYCPSLLLVGICWEDVAVLSVPWSVIDTLWKVTKIEFG